MSNPASVAHGPSLIGIFLNVMLYGIMVAQTWMYYTSYPEDRTWMKLLVGGLFIIDTINSVFDMFWIYDILVNHFGDVGALQTANWVFATDPAMVGIIATAVQFFFAWRVKVLTGNIWVVMLIVGTSFCSSLGGIGTAIAIHIIPQFTEFQKFKVIVIIWLIGTALCDATITIALTLYLRRHRTGISNTDGVLNKIIRLTVQNGLITAICAVIDLIAFLGSSSGLHLVFNFPLAKLYTNSLLSTLNSRAGWKAQTSRTPGQKEGPHSSGAYNAARDIMAVATPITHQEVFINVESHEMVDSTYSRGDVKWDPQSTTKDTGKGLIVDSESV